MLATMGNQNFKKYFEDFPGGPVAKTPCYQSKEPRFNP